jgi:methionyl-tRNA formyltransferase
MDDLKKINIVFLGTPQFAVPILEKLILEKFNVVLVITQPDKPSGRNLKIVFNPIKMIALKNNLDIFQPENINLPENVAKIKAYSPHLLITVGYGSYLKREIRKIGCFGAINVHPSILPKYRGPDPIRETLLNSDSLCGISIFKLNSQMDAGDIILQETYPLSKEINFTELENFLSVKSSELISNAIEFIINPKFVLLKQDQSKVSYSKKLLKEDNLANFNLLADDFLTKIRSYSLQPGYICKFRDKNLKLLSAKILRYTDNLNVGVISLDNPKNGITVSLKNADLLITQLQYDGKKIMKASEFINGARLKNGELLKNV